MTDGEADRQLSLRAASSIPLPPEIAKIVTGTLQNIVPDVINGTISADSALEKLEREANDMWETLYKN